MLKRTVKVSGGADQDEKAREIKGKKFKKEREGDENKNKKVLE